MNDHKGGGGEEEEEGGKRKRRLIQTPLWNYCKRHAPDPSQVISIERLPWICKGVLLGYLDMTDYAIEWVLSELPKEIRILWLQHSNVEILHLKTHKEYRINGKLHRLDGPSKVYKNGGKRWFQANQLHRVDGPAVIYGNGGKRWFQFGKLHRVDGPAVIYKNGGKRFYIHGKVQ
jgi:hypothetical protein